MYLSRQLGSLRPQKHYNFSKAKYQTKNDKNLSQPLIRSKNQSLLPDNLEIKEKYRSLLMYIVIFEAEVNSEYWRVSCRNMTTHGLT